MAREYPLARLGFPIIRERRREAPAGLMAPRESSRWRTGPRLFTMRQPKRSISLMTRQGQGRWPAKVAVTEDYDDALKTYLSSKASALPAGSSSTALAFADDSSHQQSYACWCRSTRV